VAPLSEQVSFSRCGVSRKITSAANVSSSVHPPLTASGGGYFTPLEQFTDEWQAGKKTDLKAGLQEVNDQISQALQQGEAP